MVILQVIPPLSLQRFLGDSHMKILIKVCCYRWGCSSKKGCPLFQKSISTLQLTLAVLGLNLYRDCIDRQKIVEESNNFELENGSASHRIGLGNWWLGWRRGTFKLKLNYYPSLIKLRINLLLFWGILLTFL